MPPQTTVKLTGLYTRLPAGHVFTTEATYRYNLNCSNNLIWDNAGYDAMYGMIYAWDAVAGKFVLPTVALKDALMGVSMFDANFLDKGGYKSKDLFNAEVVGDRVLQCVPGITIKVFDPIHLVVAGVNAGKVTNVGSSTAGSETRRLNGHFLEGKAATDVNCGAFFDLKPGAVIAVGV
jgi:hypothetical protein